MLSTVAAQAYTGCKSPPCLPLGCSFCWKWCQVKAGWGESSPTHPSTRGISRNRAGSPLFSLLCSESRRACSTQLAAPANLASPIQQQNVIQTHSWQSLYVLVLHPLAKGDLNSGSSNSLLQWQKAAQILSSPSAGGTSRSHHQENQRAGRRKLCLFCKPGTDSPYLEALGSPEHTIYSCQQHYQELSGIPTSIEQLGTKCRISYNSIDMT